MKYVVDEGYRVTLLVHVRPWLVLAASAESWKSSFRPDWRGPQIEQGLKVQIRIETIESEIMYTEVHHEQTRPR